MIRVTVELISAISPNRDKILGYCTIVNVGGSETNGNYRIRLSKWAPKQKETWKSGEVKNFPRLKRGPWDLLYLALKAIVGDRNLEGGQDGGKKEHP